MSRGAVGEILGEVGESAGDEVGLAILQRELDGLLSSDVVFYLRYSQGHVDVVMAVMVQRRGRMRWDSRLKTRTYWFSRRDDDRGSAVISTPEGAAVCADSSKLQAGQRQRRGRAGRTSWSEILAFRPGRKFKLELHGGPGQSFDRGGRAGHVAGVALVLLGRAHVPLGRLPGDIVYRGKNTTFYFPLATSILVSVVLSVVLYLIGRWR